MEAFCIKCRVKKEIEAGTEKTWANGTRVMQGTCPDCKGKLFRILPKKKAE